MSIAAELEIWKCELQKSELIANECVEEIKNKLKEIKSDEIKEKVSSKVICDICLLVKDGCTNFGAFNELFHLLTPNLGLKYWRNYISRLHYYFSTLIIKDLWTEAESLVPLIKTKPTENAEVLTTYFEMIKFKYAKLIVSKSPTVTEKNNEFFDNLILTFREARKIGQDLFLKFFNEMIRIQKNWIFQLLEFNYEISYGFFGEIFDIMKTIENVNNFDETFINLTEKLHVLLRLDQHHGSKAPKISLAYISACMHIKDIQKNEFLNKAMQFIYLLIKLCYLENENDFNKHFSVVHSKLIKILELNRVNEITFLDIVVTVLGILTLNAANIIKLINKENIINYYGFLWKSLNIIYHVNYNKTFCLHCSSLKRHQIFNIVHIATLLFQKLIELKIDDDYSSKVFVKIFRYALDVYPTFTCPTANALLKNILLNIIKVAGTIDTDTLGNSAVEILDLINSKKFDFEIVSKQRLLYLYKKIFFNLKRYNDALHMYCISMVDQLNNPEVSRELLINEISCCCVLQQKLPMPSNETICDILDMMPLVETRFEVPPYDKVKVLLLQLEVCFANSNNKILLENLVNKAFEIVNNEDDLGWVVSKIGKVTIPNMEIKIEHALKSLQKRLHKLSSNQWKIYLALGQLSYRLIQFKLEELKNCYNLNKVSGDDFNSFNCEQLIKNIDISVENDLIDSCSKCVEYFRKHFQEALRKNPEELIMTSGSKHDWVNVIDSVSYLARQFNLRGYVLQSFDAWYLIYEIAKHIDDCLNKIRALSYFVEWHHAIDHERMGKLNLQSEIAIMSDTIVDNFKIIDSLTPRQQNYVLVCILNLALFYMHQSCFTEANLLCKMVSQRREEMEQRRDQFELIYAYVHLINFRLLTHCSSTQMALSPLVFISEIFETLRDVKHITSEDTVNIPAFLFTIIPEITNFLLNRLRIVSVKPFLIMLLKMATVIGSTYRTAQILTLLAAIDLQMESTHECQKKLILLDILLMHETKFEKKEFVTTSLEKTKEKSPLPILQHYEKYFEQSRKAIPERPLSPKNFVGKLPIDNPESLTVKYLIDHPASCICNLCKNSIFKMISFEVGCLRARSQFICGSLDCSNQYFSAAMKFWMQTKSITINIIFHSNFFRMMCYYVNSLRLLKSYYLALELCDTALEHYNQNRQYFDVAFQQMFFEQKRAILYITEIKKEKEKLMPKIETNTKVTVTYTSHLFTSEPTTVKVEKKSSSQNLLVDCNQNKIRKELKYSPLEIYTETAPYTTSSAPELKLAKAKSGIGDTGKRRCPPKVNLNASVAKENGKFSTKVGVLEQLSRLAITEEHVDRRKLKKKIDSRMDKKKTSDTKSTTKDLTKNAPLEICSVSTSTTTQCQLSEIKEKLCNSSLSLEKKSTTIHKKSKTTVKSIINVTERNVRATRSTRQLK